MRSFALLRTLIVGSVFVALWTWWVPCWLGAPLQIVHPAGWILIAAGGAICAWCMVVFALRGIGTPAPFDPPRKLVVSGPYRFVRNPMYVGFAIVLLGEAWLVASMEIVYELLVLAAVIGAFVVLYEEPTLRRKFGAEYGRYCASVRRWLPRLTPFDNRPAAT